MGLLITTEDALTSEETVTNKREVIEKVIDSVLKLPRGRERWRAAVDMYLLLNMSSTPGLTAQQEYDITVEDNKNTRMMQANKFGTSEDKSEENMRYQLEMPAGAHHMIELVDPQAFTKENIAALRSEFKEFVIAEKY